MKSKGGRLDLRLAKAFSRITRVCENYKRESEERDSSELHFGYSWVVILRDS
jgi:hypothetical protein